MIEWWRSCLNFGIFVAGDLVAYYLIATPLALFAAGAILHKKRTRAGLIAATAVLTLLLGIVGVTFGHGGTGLPLLVIAPCVPQSLVFVLPSLIINVPVALGLAMLIRKIVK